MEYKDEKTGIVARSNGSAAGNSFLAGFIQAGKDLAAEEVKRGNYAKSLGCCIHMHWSGWFRTENNNFRAGADPKLKIGDRVEIMPFTDGKFIGPVEIGGLVYVEETHSKKYILCKILEKKKWRISTGCQKYDELICVVESFGNFLE